jgi:hypothetical protein
LSVWWSSTRSAVTFCCDVWATTVIAWNARFWNSASSFVTLIFLACEFATVLIHDVHCAGFYQTSQHVVPHGAVFLG